VIENGERVNFLRKLHLFYDVKDEQLAFIAETLTEVEGKPGQSLISQGSRGQDLYVIYDGSARVVRSAEGQKEQLAKLVAGDFFGEDELLTGKPRFASVIAETKITLLVISPEHFKILQKQIPGLRATLELARQTHRLARATNFKWLAEGEVIYFIARKHWVLLVQSLTGPVVLFGLPFFLVAWGLVAGAFWPIFVGGLLSLAVLGWIVWNVIDWTNDYYIVTNQRVIWLEKIIGLYDSRQEAPLATLLSVGVETDLLGRMLDYGNVVVRTFVGQIRFNYVIHPHEASHLISEQWERTKEGTSVMEREAMKKALVDKFRENLGLTLEVKSQPPPRLVEPKRPTRRAVVFSLAGLLGGNLFKIRFEDSGTITYRKHWFVLIRQLFQPSAFILLIVAWMAYRGGNLLLTSGTILHQTADGRTLPDTLLISLPLLLVPLTLWWTYKYVDWRNDIFQVTPDQILDIDKKPFGTEERRAAPLDNILSTQSSRMGLTGYVFNYGTVYITVGGSQLAFEDVSDPASVQGDIDRRRASRIAQKKETGARQERDRMADWLISYHENAEELRRQQHTSEDEPTRE